MSARDDAGPRPYFFLSYAHTAPLALVEPEPTDHWIKAVFDDLSAAVRLAAGFDEHRSVGFFDGLLKASDDWKARVAAELSDANVFVPLYSPKYFSMTWPGREWTCFTERLPDDSVEVPRDHIVPVLWTPMIGAAGPPRLPDPLSLVPDVPEYAENGLFAMKKLNYFRDEYEQVVTELAAHIVGAAGERPLARSTVSSLDQVPSAFQYKGIEADFVIAVAAPAVGTVPAGRATSRYGESATDWRPFDELGEVRLAERPLAVAERLGFNTSVVSAQAAADEPLTTPGVVLIDPWIAAPSAAGESTALQGLRALYARTESQTWAMPVLVLNERDPESTACQNDLVPRITRILEEVKAPLAESTSSGHRLVTSVAGLDAVLPRLVAEAERRYLRRLPDYPNDLDGGGESCADDGTSPLDSDGWEQRDDSGA